MEEKKYNVSDVMKKLGLAKTTILRWEKDGKIPQAQRDKMGWRYWNEDSFKNIVALASQVPEGPKAKLAEPLVTLISIGGLHIPIPEFSEEIQRTNKLISPIEVEVPKFEIWPTERFLPTLSKENKFDLIPQKKQFAEANIFQIKFATAAMLAALTLFASSTITTGFANGFKNSWLGFEHAFTRASEQTVSSAAFLSGVFHKANSKQFDQKYFSFFNETSIAFNQSGYEVKNFYKEGALGLLDGIYFHGQYAKKILYNLSANVFLIQESGESSGADLGTFAVDISRIYYFYIDDMNSKMTSILEGFYEASLVMNEAVPDLISAVGSIEISLSSSSKRISFYDTLAADFEFLKPDIINLPIDIVNFYLTRTKDAIYAARDIFIGVSFFALEIGEKGPIYFTKLGNDLASLNNSNSLSTANGYVVLKFLIGQ